MKQKLPNTVIQIRGALLKQGYSVSQATSLGYVNYFEARDAVSVALSEGRERVKRRKYSCYCETCKYSHEHANAGAVRDFIERHKGHKTKTGVIK